MMNQFNYLQELSYIISNPYISGIHMVKAMVAANGIIDSVLYSDSYASGEMPKSLDALSEVGISVLEDSTNFYLNKKQDNDTIVDSIRHLNNLYLANQNPDFDAFNNENINTTTCCNQSGENFLSCNGTLDYNVKYSGDDYSINTPFMLSGIFEPADNIEIFKGIDNIFNIDTVVTGVGTDGSGTVEHPFKAINFQRIPCETGLLDPSLSAIHGPTANGTISINIPVSSPITQLKYTCQSGEDSLNSTSTSGHVYGTGIEINVKKERGKILTLDPTKVSLVPVKPEYVMKSGEHDHIPSKFWDFDQDIPCKYGGIKTIKAIANRAINCVDFDNFVYENRGIYGLQQIRTNVPDVSYYMYFKDIGLHPAGLTQVAGPGISSLFPRQYLKSSTLTAEDKTKFTLDIGKNPTTDLQYYDSRGDMDYKEDSTRWPSERVNIYFSSGYYSVSGLDCNHNRFVNTVDDYGFKLCYNSGVLDSFRNISLVDIRTNAYPIVLTTRANTASTVSSLYTKTLEALPNVYLDENFNSIRFFNLEERARAGLKTYQYYYAMVIVENREWDANAGHAYVRTVLETNATRGQMFIASVDEIGRNDHEIGPINWFMGSSVGEGLGGSYVARGGITLRGLNAEPFDRCPGDVGSIGYIDCYTQLAQLYIACNGDGGTEGPFDNDMMTFLGYDLNLTPGTVLSDYISPGDLITGPYIFPGTTVLNVYDGLASCDPNTVPYGFYENYGGLPSGIGYSDNPCYGHDGSLPYAFSSENGACGPYLRMSTDLTFSDYPLEAQFRGVRYSSYKFTNPSAIGSTEVKLNYLLRSNKAVLYAHAVRVIDPLTGQPVIYTMFTSFEYFEIWRTLSGALGGTPTIFPKYKFPVIHPSQSYGFTNFTFSNFNGCYRPVALAAIEAKISQPGAGVANSEYLNYYNYSRRNCQGLYPYYDITAINGGLCPDQLDPFCVICQGYTGGGTAYNPLNATPCLAEDILDYEGKSFYNLPVNMPGDGSGGMPSANRLVRADVLVWGYVVVVELEFAASVTVVGSPTLQVTLEPPTTVVTATLNAAESTSTLVRFAYNAPNGLFDSGTFVTDGDGKIILGGDAGSSINDSASGAAVELRTTSSSGGTGAVYGPTFDAGEGAATWQSGGATGHEGNSVFPSGKVQDPRRRFPQGDLGGNAIAVDSEGTVMNTNYFGYVDPVSDIINNHNRTHLPKTAGGYDLPDTKPSTFQVVHTQSTAINAPTSNDIFRVYTPDGFAAFLVGIIGNVGIIEHKYYHPPVAVPMGTDTSADGWNGNSLPDCWESDLSRAPDGDEVQKIKVCRKETVPLFMGSFHATTILNNLHINVSQDHKPDSSGLNSYPDSWTRKRIENPVNYTGIAGVLVPPTGFTYFHNDVIMHHNLIGEDYATTLARTDAGLLSKLLSSIESNTTYTKENRIKHSNTNVQMLSGGEIKDWYCYELPQKLFSDNCFDTFFGPLTYERYLLGNPYSDYLSMWSNRCCRERGCDCPDGLYDKFGLDYQGAKTSYRLEAGPWAGSIGSQERALATKWGHSVPEGGYGWNIECIICDGIDDRHFDYSAGEKIALGDAYAGHPGFSYVCGVKDNNYTGYVCSEKYPGLANITCDGGTRVPGYSVYGYGGSAPGGINNLGAPTQPDGSPHPTNCCELPPDTPCIVGWEPLSPTPAGENFSECQGCQAYRTVDPDTGAVSATTYVNYAGTRCAGGSLYLNYVEIYYDKETDGYGSSLYARSVTEIGYIKPVYPIGIPRAPEFDPFGNLQTFTPDDCTGFVDGTAISETEWSTQNQFGPDQCILSGDCVDAVDYGPWQKVDCPAGDGSYSTSLANTYFSVSTNLRGDCEASFILSEANCLMGDKNIYG